MSEDGPHEYDRTYEDVVDYRVRRRAGYSRKLDWQPPSAVPSDCLEHADDRTVVSRTQKERLRRSVSGSPQRLPHW